MKGLRKYEVIVLIALYIENRRVEKVSFEVLQERVDVLLGDMKEKETENMRKGNFKVDKEIEGLFKYGNWSRAIITTAMFRDIVKRLQAYGLVSMLIESQKLTDNCQVSHHNYFDICDLQNAYEKNEIYQTQKK